MDASQYFYVVRSSGAEGQQYAIYKHACSVMNMLIDSNRNRIPKNQILCTDFQSCFNNASLVELSLSEQAVEKCEGRIIHVVQALSRVMRSMTNISNISMYGIKIAAVNTMIGGKQVSTFKLNNDFMTNAYYESVRQEFVGAATTEAVQSIAKINGDLRLSSSKQSCFQEFKYFGSVREMIAKSIVAGKVDIAVAASAPVVAVADSQVDDLEDMFNQIDLRETHQNAVAPADPTYHLVSCSFQVSKKHDNLSFLVIDIKTLEAEAEADESGRIKFGSGCALEELFNFTKYTGDRQNIENFGKKYATTEDPLYYDSGYRYLAIDVTESFKVLCDNNQPTFDFTVPVLCERAGFGKVTAFYTVHLTFQAAENGQVVSNLEECLLSRCKISTITFMPVPKTTIGYYAEATFDSVEHCNPVSFYEAESLLAFGDKHAEIVKKLSHDSTPSSVFGCVIDAKVGQHKIIENLTVHVDDIPHKNAYVLARLILKNSILVLDQSYLQKGAKQNEFAFFSKYKLGGGKRMKFLYPLTTPEIVNDYSLLSLHKSTKAKEWKDVDREEMEKYLFQAAKKLTILGKIIRNSHERYMTCCWEVGNHLHANCPYSGAPPDYGKPTESRRGFSYVFAVRGKAMSKVLLPEPGRVTMYAKMIKPDSDDGTDDVTYEPIDEGVLAYLNQCLEYDYEERCPSDVSIVKGVWLTKPSFHLEPEEVVEEDVPPKKSRAGRTSGSTKKQTEPVDDVIPREEHEGLDGIEHSDKFVYDETLKLGTRDGNVYEIAHTQDSSNLAETCSNCRYIASILAMEIYGFCVPKMSPAGITHESTEGAMYMDSKLDSTAQTDKGTKNKKTGAQDVSEEEKSAEDSKLNTLAYHIADWLTLPLVVNGVKINRYLLAGQVFQFISISAGYYIRPITELIHYIGNYSENARDLINKLMHEKGAPLGIDVRVLISILEKNIGHYFSEARTIFEYFKIGTEGTEAGLKLQRLYNIRDEQLKILHDGLYKLLPAVKINGSDMQLPSGSEVRFVHTRKCNDALKIILAIGFEIGLLFIRTLENHIRETETLLDRYGTSAESRLTLLKYLVKKSQDASEHFNYVQADPSVHGAVPSVFFVEEMRGASGNQIYYANYSIFAMAFECYNFVNLSGSSKRKRTRLMVHSLDFLLPTWHYAVK